MKRFLAQTSRNVFDPKKKRVVLSSIFDWYGTDFTTEATDLRDYLIANGPPAAGATAKDRAWIRNADLSFGEYDWKLNDFQAK